MTAGEGAITRDLLAFLDAGPSPHHCVAEVASRLRSAGFEPLDPGASWALREGDRRYLARGGTVVGFRVGTAPAAEAGFRLVGAHTDSPNLRVKPQPDVRKERWLQVGVETYGGLLAYTWFDRDLGLAGQVVLRGEGARPETRLVRIDRPVLRVPSLAIHLNRDVATMGFNPNVQTHLQPVLGLEPAETAPGGPSPLLALVGEALDADPDSILAFDLSLMDTTPAALGGLREELVLSSRLDNQAMCHAAVHALLHAGVGRATQVVTLYDHEEVGSGSAGGAQGSLAGEVLRRLAEVEGPGAAPGGLPRAVDRSFHVSADMAHGVHPNWADRHEPQHLPRLNGGPVIKVNTQQRYATTAETAALFANLCRDAGVPYQRFVNRTDLACGTTIGPIASARLGIPTVDVGNAMLSMHSIRETAGAEDPERMTAVLGRFFELE